MAGIFGGYNVGDYKFLNGGELSYEKFSFDKIEYGRNYVNKFNNERFVIENDDLICVFDGFLFELYGYENQRDFIENELHYSRIKEFLSRLDGIFSLFIYFKSKKKIFLATDHLASMKIFFSKTNDRFVFSSDLFDITGLYKHFAEEIIFDLDSIYFFLGFGSVAIDRTLFKNIHKLEAGTYLEFDVSTHEYNIYKYHELEFNVNNDLIENEIVDKYEAILSKAMDRIVQLNKNYSLEFLAGLSGGLDSKSMVVALQQKNVDKITSFTFAEYGSLDQIISQKVSSDLGLVHNFLSLNNGLCLMYNFEECIRSSNGMIALHTILHSYNSFININTKQFGLMLTGQIGDAIFGSHFIGSKSIKDYICSKSHYGQVPNFIFKKIGYINKLLESYNSNNSEAYVYEGRISNGTMYGDISIRDRIDSITPFYSKELLDFTLTVPEFYREDEYIYIKWLKKYHPDVLDFKWDKCECKPTSQRKVRIFKFIHTVKNAIKKRLRLKYDGMNPFDIWFLENPNIVLHLDKVFNDNLQVLDFNEELKNDAIRLYHSGVDRYKRNKFVVVTLLLSLRIHIK